MKLLILVIATSILMASCERCYQCTSQESTVGTGVWFDVPFSNKEFCGTKKQREEYEKQNSGIDSIETNVGGTMMKVAQETKTTCN